MNFPENLLYTKDHEWILFEENYALIGITDFAQHELGDIVFLDIPSLGQVIEKETVFGTIEAVKTVSDLYMPIAGKVIEINELLINQPELINQKPYESWIIKAQLNIPNDRSHLITSVEYSKMVQ
ncbi:MAG: glycine cleavage system protein GcvH [Chitinophagaceae bacterium]|jgi:glycine cleavage system H protein